MASRTRLGLPLAAFMLTSPHAAADALDTLEVGLTVQGLGGASYTGTPDVLRADVEGVSVEPVPYEGWWGASGGGGLGAEARLWQWLGLELGVMLTQDNGDEEMGDGDLHGENLSLHLPFAVKLVAPVRGLRPLLLLGFESVVPLATRATYGSSALEVTAHAEPYVLVHGGLGFELDLPIEGIDLRVPFVFHLGFDPAARDDLRDKATYGGRRAGPTAIVERVDFDLAYDAHVYFTTGLTWFVR
jgi:hypothetical protein